MGTFGLGGLHRKSTWLYPRATFAALPPTAVDGSVALTLDTNIPYQYDSTLGWIPLVAGGGGGASGGGVIALGHRGVLSANQTYQALRVVDRTITTNVGWVPTAASTLVGISVAVNKPHPTNTYTVEVIQDPTGQQGPGPVILGGTSTLVLSAGSRTAQRRDLLTPIPLGAELGVFFRRTGGTGASTPLTSIIVVVEYSTP